VSGWSSVPLGIVAALAGVWMALFFPPAPGVGTTLNVMRLVVGSTMAAFLAAGVVALLRRDFVGHGAWMKRAYALGIAAGTQALVLIPVTFGLGVDTEASYATAMGAGWLLNAGVAEWLIRRQQQRSVRAESPRQQDVFALDRT
jgi:nitrate reductase gamma subunit